MADIQIERAHTLGLPAARKIASNWVEQAGGEFNLTCTYEEGPTSDLVRFSRSGVNGTLTVTPDRFELNAKLGFLFSAFKGKIESEVEKNLDALIAKTTAPKKENEDQ